MGAEKDLVMQTAQIGSVGAEFATQILKFFSAYIKNLEEMEILKQMQEYLKNGGQMGFLDVDAEEFNKYVKKELENENVTFYAYPYVDPKTGQSKYMVIYPDNQKEKVMDAYSKVAIDRGLASEIDRKDMTEMYKEEDLTVLKNIDMDVAYRIKNHAEKEGLTISITLNDDATCDVMAPKTQEEQLAIAYIISSYEMNSKYAKDIKEKNDYENRIENEIDKKIQNKEDFFVMDKSGYPMLRIDDEKCIFTYKDKDNNIMTEEKIRTDEEEFNLYIGRKLIEMDTYVIMTPEDKEVNDNTNGKLLKKKLDKINIETPEELKKREQYFEEIKEKYENENTLKDKENVDFKTRMEDFYVYMKHEIVTCNEIPLEKEDELFTELNLGMHQMDIEIRKGKDFETLEEKLDNIEHEIEPEKDYEKDKNYTKQVEKDNDKNEVPFSDHDAR